MIGLWGLGSLHTPDTYISLLVIFVLTYLFQIYCEEGSADLVLRVDEPLSCSYVITVYTNKLCKHGLFRSSAVRTPQAITCSPALSEERYNIYLEGVGE